MAQAVLVVVGAVTVVFILGRLGGDPARLLGGMDASEADIARLRHVLGLDRPIHEQYLSYLGNLLRGDLGVSYRQGVPAFGLVIARLPATLELAGASLLVALALGLPLGLASALARGSWLDGLVRTFALFGQAVPAFWLGIVAILIFAVWLRWLPALGRGGIDHLLLPAVTLAAYPAAIIARLFRSSLLDAMRQEYVRTARSKGLNERLIVVRHVVKNAAIPVATLIGLQVGALLGGAVITETVFNYPGIGLLAITAIYGRDFPVVQSYVIVVAVVIGVVNLLVDLSYLALDPRVRLS